MFDIEMLRAKGISEAQLSICQYINENIVKRNACTHHDFDSEPTQNLKRVCKNCGYEADVAFVLGYKQGLEHGANGKA